MSEIKSTLEGYAAEKHLRDLSKIPKEQLRAERKKQKRERIAILQEMDRLEAELCDKCKEGKANTKCSCAASEKMRLLGQKLSPGKVKEIQNPIEEFPHINESNFTIEIYHQMKAKGIGDREIMRQLGWHSAKYYDWKKSHNLVKPKKRGRPRSSVSTEIKGLTIEAYEKYKADERSDNWIGKKYGIPPTSFVRWKQENGLSEPRKPQQATQQLKGEKVMNDMEKMNVAPVIDYKAEYEALEVTHKDEVELLNKEIKQYSSYVGKKNEEITRLTDKVAELEEALAQSDQVSEMTSLQYELERLKKTGAEHLKLEVEHRNLRSRFHAVEEELEFHRNTDQLNLLVMEKYLNIRKRVDEVMS